MLMLIKRQERKINLYQESLRNILTEEVPQYIILHTRSNPGIKMKLRGF
jgi:hypothetical protein